MIHLYRKRILVYAALLLTIFLHASYYFRRSDLPDPFFVILLSQPDSHPFENSCNFPILEDEDPSLKDDIKHSGTPACPVLYPHQVVNRSMDGTFFISSSSANFKFFCSASILSGALRPNYADNKISIPYKLPRDKHFIINEDVFTISCRRKNKKYGPGAVDATSEPDDVPSRDFDVNSMSISVLVFDSTSRSQFARHMRESRKIMNEMGFVTLMGYNKVGDNSAPNLSPILAEPYKESEDYDLTDDTGDIALNKFLPFHKKIDPETIKFIWKKMEKKGCESIFNDDIMLTSLGLFHYSTKQFTPGFVKKPADHYYRPYYNHFYTMMKNKSQLCWDGKLLSEEMLMPWFLSLRKLADHCFFSFNFLTSPSHDNPNNLESVDKVLSKRLRALQNSGSLSNTLLIIMGDHGQRMHPLKKTFGGRIEERQPLMSILLPKEFKLNYPDEYNNLLTNAHRLTSNVDIHETLLDIIDNRFGKIRPKGRGLSLFTPISTSRTCTDAWIPKNFCLCQYNATDDEIGMANYHYSPIDLHFAIREHLFSYPCLNAYTVQCSSDYSLVHTHKAVRLGMRTKGNWSEMMEERVAPTGFFTENTCTVSSNRNDSLTILVRSRVESTGVSHSIPYPPLILKADGYCANIKNLDTFCTCERVDALFLKINDAED